MLQISSYLQSYPSSVFRESTKNCYLSNDRGSFSHPTIQFLGHPSKRKMEIKMGNGNFISVISRLFPSRDFIIDEKWIFIRFHFFPPSDELILNIRVIFFPLLMYIIIGNKALVGKKKKKKISPCESVNRAAQLTRPVYFDSRRNHRGNN